MAMAGFVNKDQAAQGLAVVVGPAAPWVPRTRLGGPPPYAGRTLAGEENQQQYAGGPDGHPPYRPGMQVAGDERQQHFAGGLGGNPPFAAVHAQGQQPQQHFAGPGANRIDGPLGRLAWDQQVPGPDPGVGADRAPEPQQQRALQRMMRRQGPGRRPDLTTLIIYNLPGPFNPTSILQAWPADGTFDYLEIPYNAAEGTFKGHAIINFTSTEHAVAFARAWQGRNLRRYQQEPLNIRYAHVQGLRALVNRFRGKDLGRLNRHGHLPLLFEGVERLNSRAELRALFDQ